MTPPTVRNSVAGLVLLLTLFLTACSPSPLPIASLPPSAPQVDTLPLSFPYGVASGDVDQNNAVLWTQSTVTGPLTFTVESADLAAPQLLVTTVVDAATPVTVTATDLIPGAHYTYHAENGAGEQSSGQFRTPAADGYSGLRFGASGDWRGDMAPYPSIANVAARDLDFFVLMGDTIYADIPSAAVDGQARTVDEFRRKYAEVYAAMDGDNPWPALRASTSLYITLDDHEVLNNFAGGAEAARDSRFPEEIGRVNDTATYESALEALQDYNPLTAQFYADVGDSRVDGERKLYRYRTFGQDAALIVTDSRSFRDLPLAGPDRDDAEAVAAFRQATFRTDRTMFGAAQVGDLKRDLLDAHQQGVTWIFVVVSVPVQNRGLISAQDRFEGFAAERADLLQFIAEEGICNVVFLSADIHGTLINDIHYRTAQDAPDQPTGAFEITVGPAAFYPALGEVVRQYGLDQGYVSEEESTFYRSLPVASDTDDEIDDRDDWVKAKINEELIATGYNPLGLADSALDVELVQGDYVLVEYFGWSEFDVDVESQSLTVTTYGIPPYGTTTLAEDRAGVLGRTPEVVGQFVVQPSACR